ncbi:MAG TPA: sigma-70 family RNA polymerase sigma factor [Niastella sp.]
MSPIADGDEKAFFRFYNHYANQLRPFLLKYTRSETDVEDIIQETFIRVWLNRDQLPDIENVAGWLYRIASRVYLDHLDREMKRRERKGSFGESMYGSGLAVSAERTHLLELNNIIHRVLDNLSDQKKNVYRLNRELQLKPAKIADHLNVPVGTVKNQLSSVLREIRDQLTTAGYGPLTLMHLPYLLSFLN